MPLRLWTRALRIRIESFKGMRGNLYYSGLNHSAIRKALARWFEKEQRDLPWRRTRDPYAIWISEIMLQQTRVTAVIPYYERFLARFPDFVALATAEETEVLTMWAGLGYYSRAKPAEGSEAIGAAWQLSA